MLQPMRLASVKIRKHALWTLLVCAVSLALLCHHFVARGPFYEGKDIDFWFLASENGAKSLTGSQPATPQAKSFEAFGRMGAKAIPFLADKLRHNDITLARIYWSKWIGLPPRLRDLLPVPSAPSAPQIRATMLLSSISSADLRPLVPDLIGAYDRAFLRRFALPSNTPLDWSRQLASPRSPPLSQSASLQFTGRRDPYAAYEDDLRREICWNLARIGGNDPQLVPLLLVSMRDSNLAVANAFYPFFTEPMLDSAIESAEPALLAGLQPSEPAIAAQIVTCLGRLLPKRPEVIEPLIGALRNEDTSVRINAARALQRAPTRLEAVIPGVCALLSNGETFAVAVRTLATLAEEQPRAIPLLNTALSDPRSDVRAGVAEALGNAGGAAKTAVPKLGEMIDPSKESHNEVRYQAAVALWKIDRQPAALIPYRIKSLSASEDRTRWDAVSFLGEAGPEARAAVPALARILQDDPSNRVRGKAAIALGRIGPLAALAVPALKAALADEYANVRDAASDALRAITQPPEGRGTN
jgi:HEAT repeat protein